MAPPDRLPTPAKDVARSLERYKVQKQVYMGNISAVFKAVDLYSGAHVALKVYKKRRMDQTDKDQLEREISIHSSVKHENIVDLVNVFEDEHAVYLAQSYAQGGDLFSALKAAGHFDEVRTANTVIVPLLNALDYIHAKGIIHRDIKVENILLDADGRLKLADFGLAIDSNTARPGTRLGTWEYMAPEIHLCPFKGGPSQAHAPPSTTYSSSVDVWAVGILAYELLVGQAPFQLHEKQQLSYEDVMAETLLFPEELSPDARSFIRSALCKQGRQRPTVGQLLKHRWLRPFVTVNLLDSAPEMARVSRGDAARVREQLVRDDAPFTCPSSPSHVSCTQAASANLLPASTPRQATPPSAGSPLPVRANRKLLSKGMSMSDLGLRHSLRPMQASPDCRPSPPSCAPPGLRAAGRAGWEEPALQDVGGAAACEAGLGAMESRKLGRPAVAAYDAAESFSDRAKNHPLTHSSSARIDGSAWEGSGVTGPSSSGDSSRWARPAVIEPWPPSSPTVDGLLQLPAVKGAPERVPRLPLLTKHAPGRTTSCPDMKSRVAAAALALSTEVEPRSNGMDMAQGSNGTDAEVGSRPRAGRAEREAGMDPGQGAHSASRQSRLSRLATSGIQMLRRIAAE